VSFYLAANPDLQAAGFNFQQAVQHYVFFGFREGRIAAPSGSGATLPSPVTVGDPPPPPNSTFSFAKDLGVLPESLDARQVLGTNEFNDYYRFTLANNGVLDLSFGPIGEVATLELIKDWNQNGEIDRGDGDVLSTEGTRFQYVTIRQTIEAGNYYVEVSPSFSAQSPADLRFRFSPQPSTTPTNPGNTLNTALDIGVVGPEIRSFKEFVGGTDTSDIYRFTVSSNSDVNIGVSPLFGGIAFSLLQDVNNNGVIDQGDGDLIGRMETDFPRYRNINQAIEAGKIYYVEVEKNYGNHNYNLEISAQPRSASANTNSSPALNLNNDPLINPRSFTTANDSAIQTFIANGNSGSDLSGGVGTVTANSLINEPFAGGNDFANLLAANPVETPDFSQGFALI